MSPLTDGLAFDDVLLKPTYSEVVPRTVSLRTQLTQNIELKIPLLSAAMDTVTESALAVRLAQLGGLGVIHKNLSPETQANEVRRVKRFAAGVIHEPTTVKPSDTVAEVRALRDTHNFSSFPVVDGDRLVGILTSRDLRAAESGEVKVAAVMTKDPVTLEEGSKPDDARKQMHAHRIETLPVVRGQKLVGLVTLKDAEQEVRHPDALVDAEGRLRTGAALGVGPDRDERLDALVNAGVDVVVVDTAHGHSRGVLDAVSYTKKKYPQVEVIAGNIATAEGTLALIDAGADAVKVGIGPGSICTTRIVAGVGVPQFSAVQECAQAAADHKIPVISDGGIKYSGDVVKALAAGAQSIMVGSLLAGVKESPGEIVLYEGRKFKSYRGMGSLGAMQQGSADRYAQDAKTEQKKLVPEGIEGRVPFKGPLSETVWQLMGGLKSGMGYLGASAIAELSERASFVRISTAGLRESHVHDVVITKEAPNYSR